MAVLADDRVTPRIRGSLYARRAVRVTGADELRPLVRRFDGGADGAIDASQLSTWYVRMDPPAPR